MFDTLLFVCAICEREVRDYPDRNGRERHLAPLCMRCERTWTERVGKSSHGAFMDRRKSSHILALSNALHNAAAIKQWDARYGRA